MNWKNLFAVHPSITDIEQRRQSQLLAALSLALIFVGFVGMGSNIWNVMRLDTDITSVMIVGQLPILNLVAFYLNQRGYYHYAAYLILFVLFEVLILLWLDSGIISPLHYLTTLFFLTIILLPQRFAWVVLGLNMGVLLVYLSQSSASVSIPAQAPRTYMVINAPLMMVFVWHRNQIEQERQHELHATNVRLAEQVTIALNNAKLYEAEHQLALEQHAIAEQLRSIDRMKGQFLASMSHELRTPLNAIMNFTEFIKMGLLGAVNAEQEDALGKVLASGRHLLALINDVLDVAKIEAGKLNLFVEDNIDLSQELRAVFASAESLVKDKPIQLVDEIAPLPLVVGDKRRLRQVVLNLLSNAAKFTQEGTITLRAVQQNGSVEIAVIDTGPGIAPEDQIKIFEPFQQTERAAQQGGGTGLGLPISQKLIEAHGGKLWVESTLGHGARFCCSLPVRSSELLAQIRPNAPQVH